MNRFKRLTAALLLVVSIIITALPFSAEVEAAALVYSTSSNSGTRHVVCTTLEGTSADDYYTGEYTYDNLEDLSASALFDALQDLMRDTHKKKSSYDDCHYKADKADCENNNGKVTLIYTSYQATMGQWNGWNREHVWPKSLGGGNTSGGGADMHHIRPSDASVNSSRGNKKYGNVNGGSAKYGNNPASGVLGGYYNNTYYEPLDNVKGDVARICLYMYVRWNSDWGCTSITKVFQSVDVLLEWCEEDPVDTWEMGRNEVVGAYQGNRNVFIDYPELAWLIFGREVPEGMTTPSGEASSGDPSCSHSSTEIRNASSATCGKDGYTGDKHCKSCGKKMSSGAAIKATGNHKYGDWTLKNGKETRTCSVCNNVETRDCTHKNTEIKNASNPTCGSNGYTGDKYCNDCKKTVASGNKINATGEHDFGSWETVGNKQTRSCSVCNKTEERAVPQCQHTSTEVKNALDPTCGSEGYTGDTCCKNCGSLMTEGETIPPTGEHANTEIRNASTPTCGSEGYTGDTYCTDCGNKTSDGKAIPATGEHQNTELRSQTSPTCGKDGYSGDTYCLDCGNKVESGETVPATGKHFLIEGEVISEPTKKNDGLRMDACVNCNHVEGVILPALEDNNNTVVIIIVAVVAAVACAVAVSVIIIKRKKAARS